MTEGSKKVFYFLLEHYGKEYTKHQLVRELDISMATVTGSVNNLIKKGYAYERKEVIESSIDKSPIEERYVTLTELGKDYDPEKEEERIIREKAEEKARKKAERLRERAERARINSVI